jgi:hypothetical protein
VQDPHLTEKWGAFLHLTETSYRDLRDLANHLLSTIVALKPSCVDPGKSGLGPGVPGHKTPGSSTLGFHSTSTSLSFIPLFFNFYLLQYSYFRYLHLITIMQFLFSLAAFAGLALAQNAHIGLPKAGQTVAAGSDVIVQVQRPVC